MSTVMPQMGSIVILMYLHLINTPLCSSTAILNYFSNSLPITMTCKTSTVMPTKASIQCWQVFLNEPYGLVIKLWTGGSLMNNAGVFLCVTSSIQRRREHRAGRPTAGTGLRPMNPLNFTASKHSICHFVRSFQRLAVANISPDKLTTRRSSCLIRHLKLNNDF